METEWIKKIREKSDLLFEKLKANLQNENRQKEGMYFIPEKYKHAKDLYPKRVKYPPIIKQLIKYQDKL